MCRIHILRQGHALLVAAALAALGGCTKKIPIVQYPVFWEVAPKTIAVTGFKNRTLVPDAARALADELAMALTANGTYRVYNRAQLETVLKEAELQRAFSDDTEVAARSMVKVGKVQAILTGSVTACSATSRRDRKYRIRQYVNAAGRKYTRREPYVYYHNEATMVAGASLIRITGGPPRPIHSGQASATVTAGGEYPRMDPFGCLAVARARVVRKLLEEFAVIRRTVKVKQSEAFRTASGLPYEGKWPYADNFSVDDDKMYVVLRLPPECDRNRFRITVVRKDVPQAQYLAEAEIRWTRAMSAHGKFMVFSPRRIAAAGGGPGDYLVKFYSGPPQPVMTHKIKITP